MKKPVKIETVTALSPTTIVATDDAGRLWRGLMPKEDDTQVVWERLNAPEADQPAASYTPPPKTPANRRRI